MTPRAIAVWLRTPAAVMHDATFAVTWTLEGLPLVFAGDVDSLSRDPRACHALAAEATIRQRHYQTHIEPWLARFV